MRPLSHLQLFMSIQTSYVFIAIIEWSRIFLHTIGNYLTPAFLAARPAPPNANPTPGVFPAAWFLDYLYSDSNSAPTSVWTAIPYRPLVMPAYERLDTVVLNAQSHLVGTIEATSNDTETPIDDDILLVNYVDIPLDILQQFVSTGQPPPGYYLVQLDTKLGSCLVREDDVRLLNRQCEKGDVVKSGSGFGVGIGTVVNVEEEYILEPVLLDSVKHLDHVSERLASSVNDTYGGACDQLCQHPLLSGLTPIHPHALIYGVPARELRRADDIIEDDFMIYKDAVGMVESVNCSAVLLMKDESIVVVQDDEDFFLPIPDIESPLVSFPEFSHIARPDVLVAKAGFGSVIPLTDLSRGQVVLPSEKSLRKGRWLRGSFRPAESVVALVLDVRAHLIDVDWLAYNVFATGFNDVSLPTVMHYYDNLKVFTNPRELRQNKRKVIFDDEKQPRQKPLYHPVLLSESGRAVQSAQQRATVASTIKVKASEAVRFRDFAGAAIKYQNPNTTGSVQRMAYDPFMGFDLNEYKVICISQQVEVLWQDGSRSKHHSTSLKHHTLFETDLGPGEVVVGREGMKQTEQPDCLVKRDFNEMTFSERGHELFPQRVGVIQRVDPTDRVAQIRWFLDPEIVLMDSGYSLSSKSKFGAISDVVEEVSLFEVMSFVGLIRRRGEFVIIPSAYLKPTALQAIQDTEVVDTKQHGAPVMAITPMDDCNLWEIGCHLRRVVKDQIRPVHGSSTNAASVQKNDWFGQVVDVGLDGLLTVRLGGCEACRDVIVSYDMIIAIIDENVFDAPTEEEEEEEEWDDDYTESAQSAIAESVSYEGGERLDNDSGDDNWLSEEEDDTDEHLTVDAHIMDDTFHSTVDAIPLGDAPYASDAMLPKTVPEAVDAVMTDAPAEEAPQAEDTESGIVDFEGLNSLRPSIAPPAFAVLESEPPANQYQGAEPIPSSSTYLKRINKELKILSTSLPQGEIYVRTYESRLDLLRCLVIGPRDTPYEYAPFVIDLSLGPDFPRSPPTAHFHSWTSGLGRINPNLYEEGKICLSLLGTWAARSDTEGWSEKATLLQVLISLQGLVLVKKPFYNEAGYEGYEEEGAYALEAAQYGEKAFVMARGFVKHALTAPTQGLEDILAWLYLPGRPSDSEFDSFLGPGLLATVVERGRKLLERSDQPDDKEQWIDGAGRSDDPTTTFLKPLSKGAAVMLWRTIGILAKLMEA